MLQWGSLALLLGYPIWYRTGRVEALQPPILWLALFFLCVSLVRIVLRSIGSPTATEGDLHPPLGRPIVLFLRDPALWFGLAVVSLAGVQRFNAGRELVFHEEDFFWFFAPPAYPTLPSGISPEAANEAFYVTVPALIVALCLRHVLCSRRFALLLIRVFVFNAGALAVFGIIQYFSGTKSMYWILPLKEHFFASFGYPNHAGCFFLFSFCLSLGLILRDLRVRGLAGLRAPGPFLLCLVALLTFLSVHLSFCRAAILLCWLTLLLTLIWVFAVPLKDSTLAERVQAAFAALAIAIVLVSMLTVFAGDRLQKEFSALLNTEYMQKQMEMRRGLIQPALLMIRDDPMFGKGYRGFRHFVTLYVPGDELHIWKITGRANIHNDALEALVEFGAFGFTMLCLFGLVFLRTVFRSHFFDDAPRVFCCLALIMMLAHGIIDLPFRAPALLLSFALVLACLQPLARPSRKTARAGHD